MISNNWAKSLLYRRKSSFTASKFSTVIFAVELPLRLAKFLLKITAVEEIWRTSLQS